MSRKIGVMIKGTHRLFSFLWLIFMAACLLGSCNGAASSEQESTQEVVIRREVPDYIRAIPGEDEEVSEEIVQKGKVLISYSDCYICHREQSKVTGPAFRDIALRYPRNEVFIGILAQRVILGGTGAWGNAVMSPHSTLADEDARAMVSYILSVEPQ